MKNIIHKKRLVEAETEKIKEKRKATIQVKSQEEKIIIAIGRYTIGIITAIGITGAVWIALSKTL
jgi:hypothetical protein